jgi:hypothetical protein
MEQIGQLPNAEWLGTVSELFAKNGPYLVAVLFLAVALSLIPWKNVIARLLCIASFLLAVGSAIFGILVWERGNPWGPNANPNVRYVITYGILDHGHFFQSLDHVAASDDLPRAIAYSAPEGMSNKVYLILISEFPISDETTVTMFLYPKDSSSPIVFCRPAQPPEQIDIASDATKTDVPESNKFSFRVMLNGQWKPLTCNRNAAS